MFLELKTQVSEWVIVALSHCQMCNFSAISWRGQVIYWWDHDVGFVLDQHAYLDFCSASSLKNSLCVYMSLHSDTLSWFWAKTC